MLACALLAALLAITWLREPIIPKGESQTLTFTPLAAPPPDELKRHLGAFRLAGAWRMTADNGQFGSYSALTALPDGRLLAASDRGGLLWFAPPGATGRTVIGEIAAGLRKRDLDIESMTRDPVSGAIWLGWETTNSISRHDSGLRRGLRGMVKVDPAAMRDWGGNSGPEAMTRLPDGRFIVLREGFDSFSDQRTHRAALFAGDPAERARSQRFRFEGPERFSPTDMALLPDGRALILMRRLVWPFPARFAGRLALADPADIRPGETWRARQVASLTSSLPVDNFEAMAIQPRADGQAVVWLLSDDNIAATQRTVLWKLIVDPAALR